jgi:hypothetical protein
MDGLNARPSNPLRTKSIQLHRLQTHFTSSSFFVLKKEGSVKQQKGGPLIGAEGRFLGVRQIDKRLGRIDKPRWVPSAMLRVLVPPAVHCCFACFVGFAVFYAI